jgi:hypothetical protein
MPNPHPRCFSLRMCRPQRISDVAATKMKPAIGPFCNSRVDRRHQRVLLAASGIQLKRAVHGASFSFLRRHRGQNTIRGKPHPLSPFTLTELR